MELKVDYSNIKWKNNGKIKLLIIADFISIVFWLIRDKIMTTI